MKETNPHKTQKVKQWIAFADEDLNLATNALNYQPVGSYRLIAYHAQQCAEKYLQAFLVYHNVDFPYTRNIARLLELCQPYGNWINEISDAEELTPYAITTRYPGEDEEVTKTEAQEAIETAQKVRNQIRKALNKLGLKLE